MASSDVKTGNDDILDEHSFAADNEDNEESLCQSQRMVNEDMLRCGDIDVQYAPVLPCLKVPDRRERLFQQFKLPAGAVKVEGAPKKTLGARRRPKLDLGPKAFVKHNVSIELDVAPVASDAEAHQLPKELKVVPTIELPEGIEPLILWNPPEDAVAEGAVPIVVDPILCRFLREHQREGVQFMFDCVHGLKAFAGNGCILAGTTQYIVELSV
jgi:hypothetical protein